MGSRSPTNFPTDRSSPSETRDSGPLKLSSSPPSSVLRSPESTRTPTTPSSAILTSGRICTPTPSFPEVPPCTQESVTECRRRSPPSLPHHEDQDHCSSREEILRMDRRIHPCFSVHLPADVDLQARVRRIWSRNRPQEMLLRRRQKTQGF